MTTDHEPSLGRVFDAVTRTEMKVDFMLQQRLDDKAALEQRLAADKETRAAEKNAQERINEKHATELQLLRDAQQQRKGISGIAVLVFGAIAGAVVSFGLAQLVDHPSSTPSTPQMQTNCGTFVVVGSVCPSVASTGKSPSGPASRSSDTISAGRGRTLTAINRPVPQQPSKRVAVGQQKAITNPKAKAKKPTVRARVKGHKK